MVDIDVTRATEADRDVVVALVQAARLPLAGFEHVREIVVARREGRIVGTAALEVYAGGALLRSVAVEAAERGTGIGRAVVDAALERAKGLGMPAVYLLTVKNVAYYAKFGFAAIERDAVPDTVKASVEFTTACPAGAIVMWRALAATAS